MEFEVGNVTAMIHKYLYITFVYTITSSAYTAHNLIITVMNCTCLDMFNSEEQRQNNYTLHVI